MLITLKICFCRMILLCLLEHLIFKQGLLTNIIQCVSIQYRVNKYNPESRPMYNIYSISSCLMTDFVRDLEEAKYYCLFIDGATDNIAVEKELLCMGIRDANGNVQFYFVRKGTFIIDTSQTISKISLNTEFELVKLHYHNFTIAVLLSKLYWSIDYFLYCHTIMSHLD